MSQTILQDYLKQSTIYEVNLRQYSENGSIRSFIKQLPRLKDMGVQIIWMMPIHPIGAQNRKGCLGSYYSIKDFKEVNPEFGDKSDFRALVDEVHNLEMKIIIDWVANHAAWDNIWTKSNPEFFTHDQNGHFISPYDWEDVIQIDHANKRQQQAMQDAMRFWIEEYDIDGFRADLAHLTPLAFWIESRLALDKIKDGLIWLAETEELEYYQAFDILYAWKWMHASADYYRQNQVVSVLVNLLKQQEDILPANALQLYFTSNHDENSWNGTEYEKYGSCVLPLAVFDFTFPWSVPLIYSGQELPVKKRLKFFDKDSIEWTENIELHNFYKTLSQFRRHSFIGGTIKYLSSRKNILAYNRNCEERSVLVFLNLDKEKVTDDFNVAESAGIYWNVFTGERISIAENINIELEPGGFLVLEK